MKNVAFFSLSLFIFLSFHSCSKDSIDENFKNAFDCQLEDEETFIGICLNGAELVKPNEKLVYASKASTNFSEIQWEILSGSIEIISIENSLENDLPKSLATLQFSSSFSGGSIKVTAIDQNNNSIAEISDYTIELEND